MNPPIIFYKKWRSSVLSWNIYSSLPFHLLLHNYLHVYKLTTSLAFFSHGTIFEDFYWDWNENLVPFSIFEILNLISTIRRFLQRCFKFLFRLHLNWIVYLFFLFRMIRQLVINIYISRSYKKIEMKDRFYLLCILSFREVDYLPLANCIFWSIEKRRKLDRNRVWWLH